MEACAAEHAEALPREADGPEREQPIGAQENTSTISGQSSLWYSVIRMARESIGLGLAIEGSARRSSETAHRLASLPPIQRRVPKRA